MSRTIKNRCEKVLRTKHRGPERKRDDKKSNGKAPERPEGRVGDGEKERRRVELAQRDGRTGGQEDRRTGGG